MRCLVTFIVTVEMDISDPDVLARTQTDEWRDSIYDLDEDETIEMLARCLGIQGWRLSSMDGWADLPDDAAMAHIVEMTMEEWEQVEP